MSDHSDWSVPKPAHIPRPTWWPAAMALAITFLLWGTVTSLVVVAVGLALFVVALGGWIREMRHEGR
jgi:hypothetical protein